ncbi:RDD family protein [Thiomicrorhabdus sp.]|uniref:RDD family protein n=1 Tax=Thiomicrorhabdus sp. TaxID=2039724 RepID=UPI003568F4F0
MNNVQYAGFWIRTGAALIDSILIIIIIFPLLSLIYGEAYWSGEAYFFGFWDLMLNYILPAIAIILFWKYKSATPGKMALNLKIVDAKTGRQPTTGQLIGRYLAYYISIIPFFLGIIWVGIDRRKQGWHDKLAGTVVIRSTVPEPVKFESED